FDDPTLHDEDDVNSGEWIHEDHNEHNNGRVAITASGRDRGNAAQLSGGDTGAGPQLFQLFDGKPNTTYRATFWMSGNQHPADATWAVIHDWCNNDLDDDGDTIDGCTTFAQVSLNPTTGWSQMSFDVTSGGLTAGRMFLTFESDSPSGGSLFIDDV